MRQCSSREQVPSSVKTTGLPLELPIVECVGGCFPVWTGIHVFSPQSCYPSLSMLVAESCGEVRGVVERGAPLNRDYA